MRKTWKKAGAALLIAGLTVSGTSYVLANEKTTEIIDLSQLGKETIANDLMDPPEEVLTPTESQVPTEDVTVGEDKTQPEDKVDETDESVSELPKTPDGYTAGNLIALGKAYEKVQNPKAKAAIKRNIERSITKWEAKQPKVETPEQPGVEEPTQEVKESVKAKQAALNAELKREREELRAEQKEARETLKEEQKAKRDTLKEERKVNKEQQKQEKKDNKN